MVCKVYSKEIYSLIEGEMDILKISVDIVFRILRRGMVNFLGRGFTIDNMIRFVYLKKNTG